MSNFPDAHKVYELAAVFRERVIEQGRSFLWPDQEIWTVENANKLLTLEVDVFENKGPLTLQQTADALGQGDSSLQMLAADAQAACHFFWSTNLDTLRKNMRSFLEHSDIPAVDLETISQLEAQAACSVPGSWATYKQTSISWHISSVATIAALRESNGKWQDTASIEGALLDTAGPGVWFHHVWNIAHVFYPELIVSLPSDDAKKLVIKRFSEAVGVDPAAGDMAKLQSIREYLSPRLEDDLFDFFHPSIYLEWESRQNYIRKWFEYERGGPIPDELVQEYARQTDDLGTQNTSIGLTSTSGSGLPKKPDGLYVSHVVADRAPVYEIASAFKSRVIEHGKSLFWPDEDLWNDEAIEQFYVDFQSMPAVKGNSWLQNYEFHLQNRNETSSRILADSYAFIMQFPSTDTFKGESKSSDLEKILDWKPEFAPDDDQLTSVKSAFHIGIGSPGMYFSAHIQYQVAFVPEFVRVFRKQVDGNILSAVNSTAAKLKSDYSFKRSVVPAMNVVTHLLEPTKFERIASRADKISIVETFTSLIDELEPDPDSGLDSQLRIIRERLAPEYFEPRFDFYDVNVKPFWNSDNPPPWPPTRSGPPTIADLAASTRLEEARLRELEDLLYDKKQLIFEGPPGSGKTFVAEKFARYITGQPLDDPGSDTKDDKSITGNDQIELVQFHQSYSYEDFVEGIRPQTIDGQLHYNVVPGIFRKFADTAKRNPERKFVLIIDEINRGNVSRILGELMLLLEYRQKSATLPYSQAPLTIPPNLYIIGTMNSADRSLSQIDYALRRRFYFVRFMSVEDGKADVLTRWLEKSTPDSDNNQRAVDVFVQLNTKLSERLGTDDLQVGHSYFMRADIHDPRAQERVWKYAVMPLLREYLYHDRERDKVLEGFDLDVIRAELAPTLPEAESSDDLMNDGETGDDFS